jgi:dCTP deaminase
MLLSDIELGAEIDQGRLVFDPNLPPSRLQSASIDLALHGQFFRPAVPSGPGISFEVDIAQAEAYQYFEPIEGDVVLGPGDFVLGETAEALSLPQHLAGWIEGKSGRARHGLIVHCTAPHIAPGWGTPRPRRITLEIANLGKANLRLRPGIAIAQLLVMRLGSPSLAQYSGAHMARGTTGTT